jgi:hypothetical protein
MRKMKWAIGAVAVLFSAVSLSRAADDDTFDLRGPAPKKGQEFVSKGTLKIKDADTTMKVMGQEITLKITLNVTSEESAKVLTVDGREVTKCQVKVVKERADVTANLAGVEMTQTEPTALEGETIISERDGKKWKHSLVDTKPSEKQKKELDNRNGIENDDDLYPKDKVKVGHTWTVDAAALTRLLGNSFTDVKGKLDQKLVKIEDVDGEKCAVIESSGKISGKMKDDGEPTIDVEMELKITTYKSLASGVPVKEKFTGKIKLEGTQKVEDVKAEIKMSGPISGETTTKLK